MDYASTTFGNGTYANTYTHGIVTGPFSARQGGWVSMGAGVGSGRGVVEAKRGGLGDVGGVHGYTPPQT